MINEIKQNFSKNIEKILKDTFVKAYKNEWRTLDIDCGDGVKFRRSMGIYSLLEKVNSMDTMKSKILAILRNDIDQIIESYNTTM